MMDLHANLKAKNILKLSSIIVYVTNTFYFWNKFQTREMCQIFDATWHKLTKMLILEILWLEIQGLRLLLYALASSL